MKFNKHQPTPNLTQLEDKALSDSDNVFQLQDKDISPLKKINLKKAEIENDKSLKLKVTESVTVLDKIAQIAKSEIELIYSKRTFDTEDFPLISNDIFSIRVSFYKRIIINLKSTPKDALLMNNMCLISIL